MPANPGAKRANEKAKRKREAARKARALSRPRARTDAPEGGAPEADAPFDLEGRSSIDFDELDRLSAEVPALLKKKKIDEAARACAEMVRQYPGQPDGWQRFAAVHEARGDLPKALAEMERAAARVSADDDVSAATIAKELTRLRALVAKLR
jgi:tetratricopeptide (TPR) repeat protein